MNVDVGFQSEGTQPGIQAKAPTSNRALVVVAVGVVAVFLVVAIALGAAKFINKAPQAGSVLITALPATAQVKLNGQPIACTMPCRIDNLGVGKHLVEVSDEGYVSQSLPVEVSDGRVMPVDLVLKPAGPAMGEIKVTFPDDVSEMTVFLDGTLTTREALEAAFSVEQGEHLVEVLAPGFRPFRQFIDVRDGASTVAVDLQPLGFDVEIQGTTGSVVRVNGERRGTVPVRVTLDPFALNEIEVSLRSVGVSRWKGILALPEIAQSTIDLDFDRPATAYKTRDFGWLAATTGEDWWAVWVDDIDTGLVTPIDATKRLPLRKGSHVISFRRGYDRHDVEVDVRGGETLVMRENFDFVWKP
ncbi:MAG: PEGA domain-containing protein [bacterium]